MSSFFRGTTAFRAFSLVSVVSFAALVKALPLPVVPPPIVIPAPVQDHGLPYTRSAHPLALSKIKDEIAVFTGSRYAYVYGHKARLDQSQLRGGEATFADGKILVPPSFAGVLDLVKISPPPAPTYLADKWVYDLGLEEKQGPPVELAALAKARGLKVYQDARGLLLIGKSEITFDAGDAVLEDSVITLFDTPEKFADPDIATRNIPTLARQGKMADHVKVTPEQWAILNGPETQWPTAPKSSYDLSGFNEKLLGSAVPLPGVYPRLLFSPDDVPMLSRRIKSSKLGQMSLTEMDYAFKKSWWDPSTSDGQLFDQLAEGDTAGLDFDSLPLTSPTSLPHVFKGEKAGIFSTHIAYVPECLTDMAFYCLLTHDDVHGRKAAAAIVNYYKMREAILDEADEISDSEFGSSLTAKDGSVIPMNGNGATTHWRTNGASIAHMNLGLALDFGGKWMTPDQKDTMRRIIAKACYGRRSYGQDAPVRFRDVNWVGWDLTQFIANQEIEGLDGFDPEVSESGMETVRSFCDWGIDESGVVYESNGKTPGSFQFITLSLVASARRGENYFGHPHLRKLLTGQIQMTSPSGMVTVNSGTQYVPYSRSPLSFQFTDELKAFFPCDRRPDYLLGRAKLYGGLKDESMREWMIDDFDPDAFKDNVSKLVRLRLPSPMYPGFVHGVLYDTDFQPTTRAELAMPLDFNAPVHGVFSSYSDRSTDAAWINLMVRPDIYLGAGHHHADAGTFHFSGLGVDWFTQTALTQEYDGKYYNLVQVDGHSEPESLPGFISGYPGAPKYLGAILGQSATAASADLTYSYSYRWATQPAQTWPDSVKDLGWELEPSPDILKIFAGTARYKLREWWSNYNYSNYIATCRAPFNPMQYVFRTAGLVRGRHPYGYVIDDLKKDDGVHLYQWVGMLNGGVWKADVGNLPANLMVLGFRAQMPGVKADASEMKAPIIPAAGEPLLLVCALNLTAGGDGGRPLINVETLNGPLDRNGKVQMYDRLCVSSRGTIGSFKMLLIPYRSGEALPKITYHASISIATIEWPKQKDEFFFQSDDTRRTHVSIRRGGETLAESK